ncbi:phosphate/phosphite/phosphonate ABC transporter substrate-binding protein [Nesterenkonia sp. MY13]|uniref:Phosphate/phosphite/phosphonate ABC transporter substrate-binding protein n=1 Tax=Nesterenkonia sedimenti TaxID=1463632 RepID=A0A7X8YD77_9MICC|nr:phosphate/phosphite/phosphonate ABC transporter substrate-binding protein [Nesterenkonia sedimenti]NLS09101.1 phosphate/phosphite/phosphonate ABC transporter substrate-binding protein [Nesterenkonia sedimenti]
MSTETEPLRKKLFSKLGVAAVAGIFALSACGEAADDGNGAGSDGADEASGEDTNGEDAVDGDPEGTVEGEGEPIRIVGVPAEEATQLEAGFELLMEVIGGETGRPVEFNHSTDYNAVIEAMVSGQADMGIGSPFTYVRAGDAGAGVDVLGGRIEEEGEEAGYVSYALVRADSDIDSLEDVEGESVCYVEQGSTSGFLYPSAGMMEAGLDPEEDVDPQYPGSHDGAILALLDGQCELAFAYDSMVEVLMPNRGELSEDDYKIVWESPLIPASPIFMNTDTLDEETQEELRGMFDEGLINVDALVEAGYCDSADDCSLPEESYEYTPVEDDIYDGIREVCEITEAEACD